MTVFPRRWMSLGLVFLLGACESSSTAEPDPSSALSPPPESIPPVTLNPEPDEPLECNVTLLRGELPLSVVVNTEIETDDFTTDCSKGDTSGDKDAAFYFQAPQSGYFSFEFRDATFDSVLSLHMPDCEAEEIRCNDDAQGWEADSRLVVPVDAGEAMVVLVDGYKPEELGQGTLLVNLAEVLCEDGLDGDSDSLADCNDPDCRLAPACLGLECPTNEFSGEIPQTMTGTISGDSVLGDATCSNGGNKAPDASFRFSASVAGTYRFNTSGSDFDTILYIRDHYCTGEELGCDDDSGDGRTSALQVELDAGQEIIVVVDGWGRDGGDYSLRVSGVEEACDDGVDNDNDGLMDCADKDCVSIDCAFGGEWPDAWIAFEEEMLVEVNLRRAAGAFCDTDEYPPVSALDMNDFLRLSARLHSFDMATQDYFEHEALDGRSPDDRIHDAGFTGDYPTGENISGGYSSATESVEGLMNSPGHCRNIMNPEYKVIGIGFSFDADSHFGEYWTQNFGGSH